MVSPCGPDLHFPKELWAYLFLFISHVAISLKCLVLFVSPFTYNEKKKNCQKKNNNKYIKFFKVTLVYNIMCFTCTLCFFLLFFLLYNIVLVLPYINMHPPWVYMCSPSWTPLPPPSPYHSSGSSQCTSPKLPVSCIEPGLAIRFLYDITEYYSAIKKNTFESVLIRWMKLKPIIQSEVSQKEEHQKYSILTHIYGI